MNKRIKGISKYLLGVFMAGVFVANANADGAPNARAATGSVASSARASGRTVSRGNSDTTRSVVRENNVVRGATTRRVIDGGVVGRSATNRVNSGGVSRAASTRNVVSGDANRSVTRTSRAASGDVVRGNVARSAIPARGGVVRAATIGASRAGVARATAVFDDVSKIGGGYGECRDSYATCMDQFCAKANETYRRCFCSERFTGFRNVETALDEATLLLARFEDNNLNAVDKTAAEVDAMYSATVGEAAIKNDTSGAAQILNEIGDLLSGKKKSSQPSAADLGMLDLDFSTGIDDIWGGGDDDGIFASNNSVTSVSDLEALALYNEAHKNCLDLTAEACGSTAVFNMAKSSYEILIAQDCNAYEKKINSQKSKVEQAVRTAEKYLRQARLDDYRAHNSQDVNECIDKVRSAVQADTACGANYVRCLDYSGVYIDPSTGEPNFTENLFKLTEMIELDGTADVLGANQDFDDFLETKKMFANMALDTCRDKAELVWTEFKRAALIEISQAQDEKIEEVKMSCVSTVKECYDTQETGLKELDSSTSQMAGALSVYAARGMCEEKVNACSKLYDGLQALVDFVATVDNARIADGCETAVKNYLNELCNPGSEAQAYPWKCRTKNVGEEGTPSSASTASIWANVQQFAVENCVNPNEKVSDAKKNWDNLSAQLKLQITGLVDEMAGLLEEQLSVACEERDGYWMPQTMTEGTPLDSFYTSTYGVPYSEKEAGSGRFSDQGKCVENSTMVRCLAYNSAGQNDMSTYDKATDTCTFTDKWYQERCMSLGSEGYYENGTCYVLPVK